MTQFLWAAVKALYRPCTWDDFINPLPLGDPGLAGKTYQYRLYPQNLSEPPSDTAIAGHYFGQFPPLDDTGFLQSGRPIWWISTADAPAHPRVTLNFALAGHTAATNAIFQLFYLPGIPPFDLDHPIAYYLTYPPQEVPLWWNDISTPASKPIPGPFEPYAVRVVPLINTDHLSNNSSLMLCELTEAAELTWTVDQYGNPVWDSLAQSQVDKYASAVTCRGWATGGRKITILTPGPSRSQSGIHGVGRNAR